MTSRSCKLGRLNIAVGMRRRKGSDTWFSISPARTDGHVKGFGVFGPKRGLVLFLHKSRKELCDE